MLPQKGYSGGTFRQDASGLEDPEAACLTSDPHKAWHIAQIYNYKAGVSRSWEPNMPARLRPTEW